MSASQLSPEELAQYQQDGKRILAMAQWLRRTVGATDAADELDAIATRQFPTVTITEQEFESMYPEED